MSNSSRIPIGAKYLVLGLLIGAVYGVGVSSAWRFKGRRAFTARDSQEAVRPRVVCFGDSLTQYGFDAERLGWLAMLSHWWERRYDVINRGYSGYNTRWLMPLVDLLFVPGGAVATKLVTIFLGANDCVLPGNAQYVPIEEYKANLETIVRHVWKAHPEARVLLITPPPIHEGKWAKHRSGQKRGMDRKQEVTKSYAKACIEVGEELSVKVVDTYTIMGAGDPSLADMYLHDGVHFTTEGNRELFEAIQGEIRRSFPELDPAYGGDATMQAPHWSLVDPANPSESVLRGL